MQNYLNGDVETMTSLLRHLQQVTIENGTPNPEKIPQNENNDPNFSISSIALVFVTFDKLNYKK